MKRDSKEQLTTNKKSEEISAKKNEETALNSSEDSSIAESGKVIKRRCVIQKLFFKPFLFLYIAIRHK